MFTKQNFMQDIAKEILWNLLKDDHKFQRQKIHIIPKSELKKHAE